jgi:hypothetical protein
MWEEAPGRPHDLVQRRFGGGTVVRGAPAQHGDPGHGGAGLGFRRSVIRLKRGPARFQGTFQKDGAKLREQGEGIEAHRVRPGAGECRRDAAQGGAPISVVKADVAGLQHPRLAPRCRHDFNEKNISEYVKTKIIPLTLSTTP